MTEKISEKLTYSFNSSIERGPSYSMSGKFDAQAYDKVSISVDPTKEVAVNLQPMPAEKVMFLGVKSDIHDDKLTYSTDSKTIKLDRDHVFVGSSPVSLLGNISILKFKNDTQSIANVEILVGREVVS
jgi:hypothetical protein